MQKRDDKIGKMTYDVILNFYSKEKEAQTETKKREEVKEASVEEEKPQSLIEKREILGEFWSLREHHRNIGFSKWSFPTFGSNELDEIICGHKPLYVFLLSSYAHR